MKTNQINLEVTSTTEGDMAAVEITPIAEAVPVKAGVASATKVMSVADKIPSNWKIVIVDGEDMIEANNLETRSVFSGTIAEFNKLLKG
jgi:hypothetical protein